MKPFNFTDNKPTPSTSFNPIAISSEMVSLFKTAQKVAPFSTTILIGGETGVGKEVLASYIHYNSNRAVHNFVKVNCGSIPESLLESEFFGYESGAFTGAKREGAQGLFEAANQGTILLDEISELSPQGQSKLLRVLQEHEVKRVGGTWSKEIDIRVIASTNRDLRLMVKEGLFRQDLFYRLFVVYLKIPPLRQRPQDIKALIEYYLAKFNQEMSLNCHLRPNLIEKLMKYSWPGNIRELRNFIEALMITTDKENIALTELPDYLKESLSIKPIFTTTGSLKKIVEDAERQTILNALATYNNTHLVADALAINYTTLMRKIKKLAIPLSNDQDCQL